MTDFAGQRDMMAARRLLGRHLAGSGVEIGPGHHPFPIAFPGVTVAYVDRWAPEENRKLFPELGPTAVFPAPDHVCNLDTDRLKPLASESQDFIVASHVLEHVAEPIGLINEMHRVLKPGGVALILLPDRRRTFDRRRQPTPLEHLVAEFEQGVTTVDDGHILEFLEAVDDPDFERCTRGSAEERQAILDQHRRRSIHAHCWAEDEFLPVLLYSIRRLGHRWEFVDGITVDDEGPEGIEFGYALRRSSVALPASVYALRLETAWTAWREDRRSQRVPAGRGAFVRSSRAWLRQWVSRRPWAELTARRLLRFGRQFRWKRPAVLRDASAARAKIDL